MQKAIEAVMNRLAVVDGDVAHKVYRDEPILVTAAQAAAFLPPQYREMRKLASGRLYYESDERIFCEQGRLMADFEDDFDYRGEFVRYFPTYQSMNDRQLRGYFSWRTGVRRGTPRQTELSFAFVYIYELLNLIGVRSPREGLRALKKFWAAYGPLDPRIDPYMRLWLKDFIVYHNLDRVLLADFFDADAGSVFDRAAATLLNYKEHNADEVFQALCSISSYNFERSRFFKKYPDDVKAVVCGVWDELSNYYAERPKQAVREKFFGKVQATPYTLFKSAVFYRDPDAPQIEDFTYKINDVHRYRCENGNWSCERFYGYSGRPQKIGGLLKTVDFLMRERYAFKSTMKLHRTTKRYLDCIRRVIEKYLEDKREKSRPKIEIDLSKLPDIRHTALKTQSKLIVEDVEQETPAASRKETTTTAATQQKIDAPLSDIQRRFLGCLLQGKPYDDLLRSRGLMPSLLVDEINESLFDYFGDTVIAYDDERPVPIEDYIEELKGIIEE